MHVTLRVLKGVPDLRTRARAAIVIDAVRLATEQHGMRVVHFSIQSGELQFIVEIDRHRALADGIKSLAISIARRLNGHLEREGTVFLDRYEAKPLRTAEEVRNALVQLYMSHGKPQRTPFDPVSSAPYFDGFIKAVPPATDNDDAPVSPAETRLLRVAWRRLGLLTPKDAPAIRPRRR